MRRHRNGAPCPLIYLKGELVSFTSGGLFGPVHNATHLVDHGLGNLGVIVETGLTAGRANLFGSLQAEVVASTLQHRRPKSGCPGGHQRRILGSQLVLQVFGGRSNDGATPRQGYRRQVGEGLANAGTGFDNQVTLARKSGRDCTGHLLLSFTTFTPTR